MIHHFNYLILAASSSSVYSACLEDHWQIQICIFNQALHQIFTRLFQVILTFKLLLGVWVTA